MTEHIIEELKRVNIEKVSNDERNEMNTNYVYNIIWNNTIYLYKTDRYRREFIITYYEIVDSNKKRIMPKKNKSYINIIKSTSKKKQLFIHYSNLSEKQREDYYLPISVDSLLEKLKKDGFTPVIVEDTGNLVIIMETTKIEELANKASKNELNIKARKK